MKLYIWAVLATVTSFVLYKCWIHDSTKKINKLDLVLLSISLFLSFFINVYVKHPISDFLLQVVSLDENAFDWPMWYVLSIMLLAPVTEEVIKLLPLALKNFRLKVFKDYRLSYNTGFLMGLLFGIGEIWYLAYSMNKIRPDVFTNSFYELFGFYGERTVVAIAHGCLTSIITVSLYNKNMFKGLLLAIVLHYLLNFGAGFYKAGLISSGTAILITGIAMIVLIKYNLNLLRSVDGQK